MSSGGVGVGGCACGCGAWDEHKGNLEEETGLKKERMATQITRAVLLAEQKAGSGGQNGECVKVSPVCIYKAARVPWVGQKPWSDEALPCGQMCVRVRVRWTRHDLVMPGE